jgi:dTMP kinase
MKIYFGASISLDRSMLPVYKKIVEQLKIQGHEVLSEYVVDPELVPGVGLTPAKLFERETETIEMADAMVAEVTAPSWGTAFLMEHALEAGKPVLVLYYKDREQPLPMMLAGHPELYVQHYDESNVGVVLRKSLKHFKDMKQRKGKLIVIDGADGSGKSTQVKLLLDYLKKKKIKHRYVSFPRYKTSFHGRHVGRFLKGEFGGNTEVSPYLSSLAFALDRLTSRGQIVEWLKEGYLVIADRYVSASMAHQGSKLDGEKQKEFLDWIYSMEYKEHKLPKEDAVLYLHVPVTNAQELLKRNRRETDMADADVAHQKKTVEMYKTLVMKMKHWQMVECVEDGELLSRQAIHQRILEVLWKQGVID